MRPAAEVIADLERYGLLQRAMTMAGGMDLARLFSAERPGRAPAAVVAVRARVLRGLQLVDPDRWAPAALAQLTGIHVSWVARMLERAALEVRVHLPGDLGRALCGVPDPDQSRDGIRAAYPEVVVQERFATEADCRVCAARWRAMREPPT